MNNKWLLFICLVFLSVTSLSVSADTDVPVTGAWMLDRVYENASGADRFMLDPDNAASVYTEMVNVYSFYEDGTAEVLTKEAGEKYLFQGFTWKEEAGTVYVYFEESVDAEYVFDPEENALHRYWKDDNADATYHDLDFCYCRVPVGKWQMKYVISIEEDQDPVTLDPESAGSLYGESGNVYNWLASGDAAVTLPDGVEEKGFWEKTDKGFVLSIGEGEALMFTYDTEEGTLHRYWDDEDPEATYHHLDFVYLPE